MAKWLEEFCYRNAWLVTGQSREILADISQRFPTVPTYHLSNGVDTKRFSHELCAKEVRQQLIEDGSCLAVYAGLHGIAQGLQQVVDAAAQLQDVEGLRILLIGDGPEKEDLQRHSATLGLNNIRFLPPYPRELMPQMLRAADIALVPLKKTLSGAVPSKLYEAMGTGLPVLLVSGGEAAEIVQETHSGCVVAPGDTAMLAKALRKLAENPILRQTMGQNGRKAAVARFDRTAIADTFIKYLEARV